MRMRLWVVVVAAALSAAALAACKTADAQTSRAASLQALRGGDISIARDSEILQASVPSGTTLAALLNVHDVLDEEATALIGRISQRFDLRRFRAGQPYRLDRFFDGRVREFAYEVDGDRRLVARRADAADADFEAEIQDIVKKREVVALERRISSDAPSLIEALDADDGLALALSLADVFAGDVDFNNDLQPGDVFRVLVERSTREDGRFGGYGPVLAAEIENAGRTLRALRFAVPDEKPGYYDERGHSLKRFFLKTPLKFDPRITSGFSRGRLHPVLNYVRAHNGVDYAAPPGAPVGAVASGTVTFAGWTSGGGYTVRIQHASGYESEYLHLSAIAAGIRARARVAQGELVGRVGATGLVTGPHLHYGLKRNGAYVNPVREHLNMPPGEPVSAVHLAVFNQERDRLFGLLTGDDKTRTTNE